jgi:hypothetical protein
MHCLFNGGLWRNYPPEIFYYIVGRSDASVALDGNSDDDGSYNYNYNDDDDGKTVSML